MSSSGVNQFVWQALGVQRETFWQIIEAARVEVGESVEAADEVAEAVVDRLAALPLDETIGFELVLDELQGESYRWDLWAAAYLISGGCSDDGFDYFRGWLIAQGRKVWETALADPDSLATVITPDLAEDGVECEDMLDAACSAYERVTGDDEAFWEARQAAEEALGGDGNDGDGPAGEDFDFDDNEEMRARLPRLAALFAEAGDDDED